MQYHSTVHGHAHELLQCQVLKLKLWAKTNPERNSSPSGHWDRIFYCQQEMQHPADGQNKQLEEKCSNIFWNIMRRWVRAHLIMLSWHLEHFSALTSLKAEQIAQLNPSAETNHVNQICTKPPEKSKQHITVGQPQELWSDPLHCVSTAMYWLCWELWGQRQGGLRGPQQPTELCSQGFCAHCRRVCSVQPPCLMVAQNGWQISFKALGWTPPKPSSQGLPAKLPLHRAGTQLSQCDAVIPRII